MPLRECYENMEIEFAQVASSLGFISPEILAYPADLSRVIHDGGSGKDAQTNGATCYNARNYAANCITRFLYFLN